MRIGTTWALGIGAVLLLVPHTATAETIAERFAPPAGYHRIAVPIGSYAAWLRERPLEPAGADAHDWRGRRVVRAREVAGVLDYSLLGRVEQCADIAIRWTADYARTNGQSPAISFRSLSGQTIAWDKWQHGRYAVNNNASRIVYHPGQPSNGPFSSYLKFVMAYVNTISLARDWRRVDRANAAIGDVLIQPHNRSAGRGHLSVIVDACEDDRGNRKYLWVDGYTPARDPVVRLQTPGRLETAWMSVKEFLHYMRRFGRGELHRPPSWVDNPATVRAGHD